MAYLSKSDFKVAQTCPTKLYYKKNGYANSLNENEYMQMLADGGYLIGKYAQLMHPEGIEITAGKPEEAFEKTKTELQKENVTLFEPCIITGGKVIRIDILQKQGNHYNILEVKAKSGDSENEDKKIESEYIEDVTFQYLVLDEFLKDSNVQNYTIDCYLYLPNKSKDTNLDLLPALFKKLETVKTAGFTKVEYQFLAPINGIEHKQLIADNFLFTKPVNADVDKLKDTVLNASKVYLNSIKPLTKIESKLTKNCFKCEYNATYIQNRNGYKECWKDLADVTPHISDLYHIGTLGGNTGVVAQQKIDEKKVHLFDILEDELVDSKGNVGSRNERQLIQLTNTKNNTEYISADASSELNTWQYPLYFIDFETTRFAMPYHKGMRPYENIAFQWSCHIVENENAEPKHYEWINTDKSFPNFRFAESLMEIVKSNGTPLMWSHHENTVLSEILVQMQKYNYQNAKLENWLNEMTTSKEKTKVLHEGRLTDMARFCMNHYFHPYMTRFTSIKKVLPAIWNHNSYLHSIPYFKEYAKIDIDGKVLSPYDTLQPISEVLEAADAEDVIKEGTAAMRAYHQMMFETNTNQAMLTKMLLLLQYCKLDTMAMVIIWKHWLMLSKNKSYNSLS